MTTGLVNDEDGLHRADVDRSLYVGSLGVIGGCGVFKLVVIVQLEYVWCLKDALAIVLALGHVDVDLDHCFSSTVDG